MTGKDLVYLLESGELKEFIEAHKDEDPSQTALKYSGRTPFPLRAAIEQIGCRQKARTKFPEFSSAGLIYEPVAVEQSSGEAAANYKSSLIGGERIIDLTGGLGIDDLHLSKKFNHLIYCERNPLLVSIFRHNSSLLGVKNIEIKEGDSIDILSSYPDNYFSWIYIDPARRNESRRFIGLESCSPNVVENLELLKNKSANILIKASPAIETEEIKKQLSGITEITAVSVNGECKEILIILNRENKTEEPVLKASVIDLRSGRTVITEISGKAGVHSERQIAGEVLAYFYEPDAAIIKARLSGELALKYDLSFVNSTVDYLTSDKYYSDFPGRVFKTIDTVSYNRKNIGLMVNKYGITSANIARRDFPDAPEVIRRNLRLKDGGSDYLFFTRSHSGSYISVYCRKV